MGWDSTTVNAMIAAIAGAFGIIITKVVDVVIANRKSKMEEREGEVKLTAAEKRSRQQEEQNALKLKQNEYDWIINNWKESYARLESNWKDSYIKLETNLGAKVDRMIEAERECQIKLATALTHWEEGKRVNEELRARIKKLEARLHNIDGEEANGGA